MDNETQEIEQTQIPQSRVMAMSMTIDLLREKPGLLETEPMLNLMNTIEKYLLEGIGGFVRVEPSEEDDAENIIRADFNKKEKEIETPSEED